MLGAFSHIRINPCYRWYHLMEKTIQICQKSDTKLFTHQTATDTNQFRCLIKYAWKFVFFLCACDICYLIWLYFKERAIVSVTVFFIFNRIHVEHGIAKKMSCLYLTDENKRITIHKWHKEISHKRQSDNRCVQNIQILTSSCIRLVQIDFSLAALIIIIDAKNSSHSTWLSDICMLRKELPRDWNELGDQLQLVLYFEFCLKKSMRLVLDLVSINKALGVNSTFFSHRIATKKMYCWCVCCS